ncbi:MAG: DUF5362 family protein [Verrucomicrobiota bacterium JB024]|nr:DUF5362 family protein [Verrucomicrobiota bacterium JB024]
MDNYTIIGGDGKEYGPVSALTLREWVQQGRANGQTLTRRGEESPRPLGELQEFSDLFAMGKGSGAKAASGPIRLGTPMASPASSPTAASSSPFPEAPSGFLGGVGGGASSDAKEEVAIMLSEPLAKTNFWLKFMAVLQFISGASAAMSLIGILYAWLPIWMGVVMWQAANRARDAVASGDLQTALAAQNKIKLLILIAGISTMVMLVLGVFAFFFFVLVAPGFMEQIQQQYQGY